MRLLSKLIDYVILYPLIFSLSTYIFLGNYKFDLSNFLISIAIGYALGYTLDFLKKSKKRVRVWEQ